MIVYTCICGPIDKLHEPPDDDLQYICYTDQPIVSKRWEIRPLMKDLGSPRLTARWHKTVGCDFVGTDTIWQDGKITFLKSPASLFTGSIALIKHPRRNCIVQEAKRAAQIGKVSISKAMEQVKGYLAEGFPLNWGLFETAVVFRRNCGINTAWWDELQKTERDQLSLPYVLWKHGIQPNILPIDYDNTDWFKVAHHPFKERILML